MSLPNSPMSFTPFDVLPAEDLNDIVENVESLAAGTGQNDLSIEPVKLNLGKSVDANGWTVYNYGNFKEYRRRIDVAGISTIAAYAVFAPAAFTGITLPVGIADMSTKHLDATLACRFSGGFVVNSGKSGGSGNSPSNNTSLTFPIYNCLNIGAAPGDVSLYLTITDK